MFNIWPWSEIKDLKERNQVLLQSRLKWEARADFLEASCDRLEKLTKELQVELSELNSLTNEDA